MVTLIIRSFSLGLRSGRMLGSQAKQEKAEQVSPHFLNLKSENLYKILTKQTKLAIPTARVHRSRRI